MDQGYRITGQRKRVRKNWDERYLRSVLDLLAPSKFNRTNDDCWYAYDKFNFFFQTSWLIAFTELYPKTIMSHYFLLALFNLMIVLQYCCSSSLVDRILYCCRGTLADPFFWEMWAIKITHFSCGIKSFKERKIIVMKLDIIFKKWRKKTSFLTPSLFIKRFRLIDI